MNNECCYPSNATLTDHNDQHPSGAEFAADGCHRCHTGRIEQAEDKQGIGNAWREDLGDGYACKEGTECTYHHLFCQKAANQ